MHTSNSPATAQASELREHPRIKVPAMYTLVRARVVGSTKYTWTGHVYDVSLGGIRFELDMPVEVGTQLELRAMLPGSDHTTFRVVGRVARIHSDVDEPGPAVMGLKFEAFRSPMDRHRLAHYIDSRQQAERIAHKRAA